MVWEDISLGIHLDRLTAREGWISYKDVRIKWNYLGTRAHIICISYEWEFHVIGRGRSVIERIINTCDGIIARETNKHTNTHTWVNHWDKSCTHQCTRSSHHTSLPAAWQEPQWINQWECRIGRLPPKLSGGFKKQTVWLVHLYE